MTAAAAARRAGAIGSCLVALLVAAGPAAGQPLADRVPQDALVYVGWAGADHLPAGYAGSHLKGVIGASDLARLFDEALPRLIRKLAGPGEAGDRAVQAIATIGGAAWRHPTAVYWGGVDLQGNIPLPRFAAWCDAGAEGKALADLLTAMTANSPPQIALRVEEAGGLVMLAMGANDLSAAKKPAAPLAQRKEFVRAMAQVAKEPIVAAYVDGEGMIRQADELVGGFGQAEGQEKWATVKDALGLAGVKRLAWAGGFAGPMWATGAYVEAPAPRSGFVAKLFEAKPLSGEVVAAIPASATMAAAGHLDLGALMSEVRAAAKKLHPGEARQMEEGLEQFRATAGVDLQADVADALGDEWAAYSDPSTGGAGLLGLTVVNRLRDPAKAEAALVKLEAALNKAIEEHRPPNDPKVAMRTVRRGDLTIHYLAVPVVAPAWAVRDGNLYVALYPQSVSAAADHVAGKGKSLADNEAFAALRKQIGPEGASAFHFVDLPRVARDGYPELLMGARAWLGLGDLLGAQTPALAVPALDQLLQHLTPSGGACWADADGWHARSVGPFPGSGLVAAGGLGPVVAGGQAALAWSAVPGISRSRARAVQVSSATNLRVIGQEMILYAHEHGGKLPGTLGELVLAQDVAAEVFLAPGGVPATPPPTDADKERRAAWVMRNAGYVYVGAGKKLGGGPDEVVAHEKLTPDARGANVLFTDGHVEWLPAERVRELVGRAGRPGL